MKRKYLLFGLLGIALSLNYSAACAADLQLDIDRATDIILGFESMSEQGIPKEVLRNAKGLAILSVMKAGFVFSGRGGSGVVVARNVNGWSGPSGIGTGGVGVGFQAGAQVTDFVFVLNTDEAVLEFAKGGNVVLGADVSVTAGPLGRDIEAGVTLTAPIYSYSRSQGIFAGMSVEGTVIATLDRANARYYSWPVSPMDILTGKIAPPAGAEKLLKALSRY